MLICTLHRSLKERGSCCGSSSPGEVTPSINWSSSPRSQIGSNPLKFFAGLLFINAKARALTTLKLTTPPLFRMLFKSNISFWSRSRRSSGRPRVSCEIEVTLSCIPCLFCYACLKVLTVLSLRLGSCALKWFRALRFPFSLAYLPICARNSGE